MGLYRRRTKRGAIWWISKNGKRFSTGETSRKKAEMVWAQFLATLQATGEARPPDVKARVLTAPPFELADADYLETRLRSGRREASYPALAKEGCWVTAFGKRPVDRISSTDIERQLNEWQDKRSWSNASRNNALAQLSGFFTYALRKGWVQVHPAKEARVEKLAVHNARTRWLRRHELEQIKQHAEPWLRNVIDFAVCTGLRFSTVCNLRRADFETDDQDNAFVVIERDKNGERVFKGIHGPIRRMIESRVAKTKFPADYLLPGPEGGNPHSSIRRQLKKAVEDAGLIWGRCNPGGITFHTLRHTMASLAANQGLGDRVQQMGNWKTRTMVGRYSHLADERLREAEAQLTEMVTGKVVTLSHTDQNRSQESEGQHGASC